MNPVGTITLWSGAIVDIPVGWQLCDGTNETPDLRNKFLRGAGDTFAVDETGGSADHLHSFAESGHAHDFTGNGHNHDSKASNQCAGSGPDQVWNAEGDNDETADESAAGTTDFAFVSGNTGSTATIPPFYALAYIQRMM